MIYVNNEHKLNSFNSNNTIILADFDGTITDHTSRGSWGLFHNRELIPKEFCDDLSKLFKYYRPIEIDPNLSYEEKSEILPKWWEENINQIINYNLTEETIKKLSNRSDLMRFRYGYQNFANYINQKNIPLIIESAGIGNFIKDFLIYQKCYYENVHIISNMIKFKDGLACGIEGNIIHIFNKNEMLYDEYVKNILKNRNKIIVIGNAIGDSYMIEDSNNTFKIGFLDNNDTIEEYLKYFDVVCDQDETYSNLLKKIKLYERIK